MQFYYFQFVDFYFHINRRSCKWSLHNIQSVTLPSVWWMTGTDMLTLAKQ